MTISAKINSPSFLRRCYVSSSEHELEFLYVHVLLRPQRFWKTRFQSRYHHYILPISNPHQSLFHCSSGHSHIFVQVFPRCRNASQRKLHQPRKGNERTQLPWSLRKSVNKGNTLYQHGVSERDSQIFRGQYILNL